jgi:hypothetical protein
VSASKLCSESSVSALYLCALVTVVACGESSPPGEPTPGGVAGSSVGGAAPGAAGAAGAGGTAAGGSSGAGATGGMPGMVGGSAGSGSGSGGSAGSGNGGGGGATAGSAGASGSAGTGNVATEKFSFFVTSLVAVRRESGSENGFGGNLGGLTGADEICRKIAEKSMVGSGAKGWRAFLSTSSENAIDRIGMGPWYDRAGRLVSMNIEGLLGTRPAGDDAIVDDLPNEDGEPNRAGTGTGQDDNHDTITGSNTMGEWDGGSTCENWTSAAGSDGPRVGHSWPAGSGMSWIQAHTAPGCEPSVSLTQNGPGSGNGIGNGGGYGGFYCFALKP